MAQETGAWLAKRNHCPQRILATPTRRTVQTAEALLKGCKTELPIEKAEVPSEHREWMGFLDGLEGKDDICIVGHHNTTDMLKGRFSLSFSSIHYASAIVLKRVSSSEWRCVDTWQGRADLP